MTGREKIPSEKILLWGIFCVDAKSQRYGQRLDFCSEEALAALFQPDTVAPAEYLKIYEKKAGLEPEKKLMLAVLEDAIGGFQNFVCATDNRQKKWFLEAEEWFNARVKEWIFSFENISEVLGIDPQYLRQRLMSWKRKRLAAA